jgi:cytochrome b561
MLVNTHKTYGLVAQLLHWTTAILILTLLGLGLFMVELPETSGADVDFWE